MDKPPLGLMPRSIHRDHRIKEILEAMQRYADKQKAIPEEWFEELMELNKQNEKKEKTQ